MHKILMVTRNTKLLWINVSRIMLIIITFYERTQSNQQQMMRSVITFLKTREAYKKIAIANLLLSIVAFLVSYDDDFSEQIMKIIIPNAGFHMMYFFFAYLCKVQRNFVQAQETVFNFITTAQKIMSYFVIFGGISMLFGLITSLFSSTENSNWTVLFFILMPFGLILGGLHLQQQLEEEK